ncbi:hypothetical protein QBC33DRAFT_501936 [Phialemonium atrogriseum]|uniref:Uncharacterized protein n=1 Tax=Phialemonium atrogriseum TaxID=1093897 RepID=A0AAJ0FIE3_9PEZI|nr:uncharacterized protein QBC33DRAFT_501936 [Phialemonium atrogriseum]KAK1762015.1 hypothetical protein QBC33DRAFT_501936 [Phialemonium atrogriseum]
MDGPNDCAPPPAYGAHVADLATDEDAAVLTASFAALDLAPGPQDPSVATCLAHLKLLFAFKGLKDDVGCHDGLWDIWDSRAHNSQNPADVLPLLREKRWAIFVARAVDRYESWWNTFPGGDTLIEADIHNGTSRYVKSTEPCEPLNLTLDELPPLDVLLVWHAHMLNPRLFLEDCLRNGRRALWSTGMPWNVVNQAIDTNFRYSVSNECKANWATSTGRPWSNEEDSTTKPVACPACSHILDIPWTTCGQSQDTKGNRRPGLVGEGFGDGALNYMCRKCGTTVDLDALKVKKFVTDTRDLVNNQRPMPGTILDVKKGMPEQALDKSTRMFPNRLVRRGILVEVINLVKSASGERVTMEQIRGIVEKAIADPNTLKRVDGLDGLQGLRPQKLSRQEQLQVRKMMSRYWENASLFALDVGGAVMRQCSFTEKMYKFDWIHSPASEATMEALLTKYDRFFQIMASHPDKVAVPTLDIDLAWHTHQLSPVSYYQFSVAKAHVFIDHDDKVDEDKLSMSFEWTSKAYENKYNEPYSECRCWYCETIRTAHSPPSKKLLGVLKTNKSSNQPAPPDREVHISAHNSVKTIESEARRRTNYQLRLLFRTRLTESYEKAAKQARKRGEVLGPREDEQNHWGKTHTLQGPWCHPHYITTSMYPEAPHIVNAGPGAPGACAAGTCGGAGGCGSGAVAMCRAGCSGGSQAGCLGGAV